MTNLSLNHAFGDVFKTIVTPDDSGRQADIHTIIGFGQRLAFVVVSAEGVEIGKTAFSQICVFSVCFGPDGFTHSMSQYLLADDEEFERGDSISYLGANHFRLGPNLELVIRVPRRTLDSTDWFIRVELEITVRAMQ